MGHLSEESKRALSAAVEAIELSSAAEIVIALSPASTPALLPASLAGGASGLLGLAFLLFSPWPFTHGTMLLDTLLVGLVGALVCRRAPALQRWLTPRRVAEESVRRAARAEFFERGITETRDRSGILIYVSQIERRAEVLADKGVLASVPAEAWRAALAPIEQRVRAGESWERVAEAVRALAPLLAAALPRREDDVNELGDAL